MKNKITLIATVLILSAVFVLPHTSLAQSGSLDVTFDADGKVTTDLGTRSEERRVG